MSVKSVVCDDCGFSLVETKSGETVYASDYIKELLRDAERYRFLRDSDNWGEDSAEGNTWEALGESSTGDFDKIVEWRMRHGGM